MAAPTVKAQNDRIRAILATFSGMGTDCSEGGALEDLPAFIVNPLGTTSRVKNAAKRYLVTREFEVIGLIARIEDINKLASRAAAYEDAEAVLEAWMEWIDRHPRLALNDGGLVVDTGELLDSGFGPYTYPADGNGKDYSAFRFVIPVITYRP
jgi:hypothetical protein